MARRLGIDRIICPPGAGAASALGLLIAPAQIDRATSIARKLGKISPADLEAMFAVLEQDAAGVMRQALVPGVGFAFERAADIRFVGPGFEIVTRLPRGPFDESTPSRIREEFAESYRRIFGQVPPVEQIELMNLRLAAIEDSAERPLLLDSAGNQAWTIGSGSREVWEDSACLR